MKMLQARKWSDSSKSVWQAKTSCLPLSQVCLLCALRYEETWPVYVLHVLHVANLEGISICTCLAEQAC